MIKKIKTLVVTLALFAGFGSLVLPNVSYAACTDATSCVKDGLNATGGSSSKTNINDILKTVVNVLLFLIAAISVIMIIVGGIKYTTSNGDSGRITTAKNTIMYSVVGLLVAIFAWAAVSFIVSKFI